MPPLLKAIASGPRRKNCMRGVSTPDRPTALWERRPGMPSCNSSREWISRQRASLIKLRFRPWRANARPRGRWRRHLMMHPRFVRRFRIVQRKSGHYCRVLRWKGAAMAINRNPKNLYLGPKPLPSISRLPLPLCHPFNSGKMDTRGRWAPCLPSGCWSCGKGAAAAWRSVAEAFAATSCTRTPGLPLSSGCV